MNNLEWLMATHDDDSKAQSKTEPNLSEQSESLSDEADSREKLEADVLKRYTYTTSTLMWPDDANIKKRWVSVPMDTVLEWLDRQAAITRAECDNLEVNNLQLHALAGEQAATIDELQASLDSTKHAIAKAGGTWTEREDRTIAVVFAPDADKLRAERDKLRDELRIEREAVEACEGCDKVDSLTAERDEWKAKAGELQQKLDWEEWPDGGEINLERAWMNHMRTIEQLQGRVKELTVERDQLKEQHGRQAETIGRLQERNGELQERVDDLEDELDETKSARDQWRKAAGDVHDMWERAATERDGYRTKLGRAIDLAGEIRRIAE